MESLPTRNEALALLHEYTRSESLRKHALCVEAAMRAYARRYAGQARGDGTAQADHPTTADEEDKTGLPHWVGDALAAEVVDEDYWGLVGLLHDFDYERYPQAPDHPLMGSEILAARGYPEDFRRAIASHVSEAGLPRTRLVEKVLFAVDELCGFLTAVALVRPDKSLAEVHAGTVRKKLKDKAFARSVNREEVRQGMEELGADFDDHVEFVIDALRGIADRPAPDPGTRGEDALRFHRREALRRLVRPCAAP
jgi:predicted hydrolase (HD superfamily)